jgi:hypothetical protein
MPRPAPYEKSKFLRSGGSSKVLNYAPNYQGRPLSNGLTNISQSWVKPRTSSFRGPQTIRIRFLGKVLIWSTRLLTKMVYVMVAKLNLEEIYGRAKLTMSNILVL